jgi:hypothetical protein
LALSINNSGNSPDVIFTDYLGNNVQANLQKQLETKQIESTNFNQKPPKKPKSHLLFLSG